MTNIAIEGPEPTAIPIHIKESTPFSIEASTTPVFDKNRAMQERETRIQNDPSYPRVAQDLAKADKLHYLMENIKNGETSDLIEVNIGEAALSNTVASAQTDELAERRLKNSFSVLPTEHSFKRVKETDSTDEVSAKAS